MRHRVREVEEKGPGRVLPDEARRLLGVAARDRRLIGRPLRHPVVAHQGHVPVLEARVHHPIALFRVLAPERGARDGDHVHVVRIGDPEVVVETVRHGQEGGQVPEVPLADGRGRVPACPENLGNRDLGGGQPAGGIRIEDALVVIHGVEAGADGQAAGEEGGAAGRANGLAHVEARPLLPFGGHAIEARSADGGVAEHAEVAPPHVVGQDDHDVGRAGGAAARGATRPRPASASAAATLGTRGGAKPVAPTCWGPGWSGEARVTSGAATAAARATLRESAR